MVKAMSGDDPLFHYHEDVIERELWPGEGETVLSLSSIYLCCIVIPFVHVPLISLLPYMIDGIPTDGIPALRIVTVAIPLSVVYITLAAAGFFFAVACLVFTFIFRKKK